MLDRKDVDVVLIATPDHWHALPTVLACQAGKDVYVEKPLAKTIDEGRAMLEAAKRHQRVVQMGSQWRSCKHIIEAADFIRSGKLGKVSIVRGWAYLDWLPSIGKPPTAPPPAGVDYDMWLGPAPKRALQPQPLPLQLPLVLGLRRRPDDRLGRASHQHDAHGHGPGRAQERLSPAAASSSSTTTPRPPTPR